MQIVAIDKDAKASGGTAPITWIGEKLLVTTHRMNPDLAGDAGNRTIGTGTIGGWGESEMRSWLKSTIKPLIPSEVRSRIVEVSKATYIYNSDETTTKNAITTDDVWIPSNREIFGGTNKESEGIYYSVVFNSAEMRKKMKVNGSSAMSWWLRSATGTALFRSVYANGDVNYGNASLPSCVALGFCT